MGPVGTGKSFFAGCIANALLEQEERVMMTNFSRILNEMTSYQADKNQIAGFARLFRTVLTEQNALLRVKIKRRASVFFTDLAADQQLNLQNMFHDMDIYLNMCHLLLQSFSYVPFLDEVTRVQVYHQQRLLHQFLFQL